jgi:hypothetical protein
MVEASVGKFLWATNSGSGISIKMTLGNDGTLDVTNSIKSAGDSTLTSATASAIGTNYKNSTTGTASTDGSFVGIASNGDMEIRQKENLPVRLFTNNTEQLTINNVGHVLVGTGAGTSGGDDNMIKAGTSDGFLNIKGGTGKAKVCIGNEAILISAGNTVFSNIDFRTGATSSTNAGSSKMVIDYLGAVGIGTTTPAAKLDVAGGIKIANDTDAASVTKVGTIRYRTSGNNSYMDMCMQTGASTYEWVNIKTNTW